MSTRLSQALDRGLALPLAATSGGPVVVLNARLDADLSLLPRDRVVAVQPFRPDHDALAQAGFAAQPGLPVGRWAATLVRVPRARDAARDLVARAAAQTDGPVIVDVAADVAEDAATNKNTAATQLSVTTDQTPPTVALTSNANDPHSGVFTVTVTFSEAVTGFVLGDGSCRECCGNSLAALSGM
jgi:hypothetical protein